MNEYGDSELYEIFKEKGYPKELLYEIKKIDLLLDALKGQKEIKGED
jgi:hypothetical protein